MLQRGVGVDPSCRKACSTERMDCETTRVKLRPQEPRGKSKRLNGLFGKAATSELVEESARADRGQKRLRERREVGLRSNRGRFEVKLRSI